MSQNKIAHLVVAIATAISLTACGGGGGTKSDPPPPVVTPPPVTPPPVTPPVTPPQPTTCQDSTATNFGGALPCNYRYNGAADNLLVPMGVDQAHASGYTGKGVKVGLLDDAKATYAPLAGANIAYADYTSQNGLSKDKPYHGVEMATVIAGQATADFRGGVAPDASLFWARVCDDNGCSGTYERNAVSDMTDAGVRLFNVSGYVRDDGDFNTADGWRRVYDKALQAGSLVVAATGNVSGSTAGLPAAIPKYFPEWTGQFIAVTGVDVDAKGNPAGLGKIIMDNGQPGTLNACGDAAQWCVSAVVPVQIPGDGGIAAGLRSGTSTATAEVTGVAALVSQAFPWMSGSELQTTILTTATDIGDAGVDRVYGWGLVNAAKAVKGPAQFLQDFDANVASGNGGTFSNSISGAGGLVKTGAGTLTLSGNNSYSGLTAIQGGTLSLSGSIAGNVSVGDATFASYGGKVGGSYIASANSVTAIQVGSGLTVGGAAALAGTLQLLAPSSTYTVGGTEKILSAGSVAGTFARTVYGNDFFWTAALAYNADNVTATLTRNASAVTAAALSATPAVIEGALHADVLVAELDKRALLGQDLGNISRATAGLLATSTPAASVALESLSGQVYGTAQSLAIAQSDADSGVLSDRLAGLGNSSDRGVWVQSYGLDGSLKHDGFASADMHLFGGMAGADFSVSDAATIGAAIATSRMRGNIDGLNGSSKGRANSIALYGRTSGDTAYLSGFAGYSSLSQDVERTIAYGTGSERVAATVEGNTWLARVEAGYKLSADFAPFVAVSHVQVERDGFNERSSSGLGFTAGKDTIRSTLGEVGLRWNTALAKATLGADLALRHRFGDRNPAFTAAFDGLQTAAFDVTGTPLSTNDVRIGLHGTYQLSDTASLFGDVSAQWDNANGRNVTGTLGVRVGF